MTKNAALVVLAFALAGCPSFSTMGIARTLPVGQTQVYFAPTIIGAAVEVGDSASTTRAAPTLALPQLEMGLRYGVADDVEIGGKLWSMGAALDAKVQVRRSPSAESGVDVALDPGVGYLGFTDGDFSFHVISLYAPLLIGFNTGGGSQLVVTPKVVDQIYSASSGSSSGSANFLFAGASLGYAWKAGGNFRLLPELSVLYPVTKPGSSSDIRYDGVVFQAGLGLLFGR